MPPVYPDASPKRYLKLAGSYTKTTAQLAATIVAAFVLGTAMCAAFLANWLHSIGIDPDEAKRAYAAARDTFKARS